MMAKSSSAVQKQAWEHASDAAKACRVELRQLTDDGVAAAQDIIGLIWGTAQIPQDNLLRAVAHAGNTLIGAFRDGEVLGCAFGFLGWNDGIHLHSHMTGVLPGGQSKGVGFALKLWQRAICLDHGITRMRWTYDPLVARNAYFNLVKLGASVRGFIPDFYGAMDDAINRGDHSDRFEITWHLSSSRVVRALNGERPRLPVDGQRVDIPRDFEGMRESEPGLASKVRMDAREAFVAHFNAGATPEWADGAYVFSVAGRG